ncbi:hypothetical protein F5141DRAFT_1206384 [Pisolithus sp. B1]|nr:hypothetical protein F5141DRAFT_1206384 [Pisolithus sp. B1]
MKRISISAGVNDIKVMEDVKLGSTCAIDDDQIHRMAAKPIVIVHVVFANNISTDYTPSQSDGPSGIRENQGESAAHQLESYTHCIRELTVHLLNDQLYVFADIPGFDRACRSDGDILCTIAEWLEKCRLFGDKGAGDVRLMSTM